MVFFFLLFLFGVHSIQFNKVFIWIFENHGYTTVTQNSYWKSVIDESFLLTNYYSPLHASQPNYVIMLAGSYFDCTSENMCYLSGTTIMDLLEAKGKTWKGYMEGYQPGSNGACSFSASGQYCRNHNPFLAFTSITGSETECQKVVNANQFMIDVVNDDLPNFAFYTPDNYNNSHDKDLDFSGAYLTNWLSKWYYPYLDKAWKDTLLIITWDEDAKDDNNHVVTMFKHPCLQTGTTYGDTQYTHYSVPLFLEENWNLGSMGREEVNAGNFMNSFPLISSCSAGQSTGGYPNDKTGKDGAVSFISEAAKNKNVLVMLILSVAFLALPLARLIWLYRRKYLSDKEQAGPSFESPLITDALYPHPSYSLGYYDGTPV